MPCPPPPPLNGAPCETGALPLRSFGTASAVSHLSPSPLAPCLGPRAVFWRWSVRPSALPRARGLCSARPCAVWGAEGGTPPVASVRMRGEGEAYASGGPEEGGLRHVPLRGCPALQALPPGERPGAGGTACVCVREGATGFAIEGRGVDTAPLARGPPPPKRAQFTGPPKLYCLRQCTSKRG